MPHGDHRIPLPKLLIVLDLTIDHGTGIFLLVCSYVTQFLHACLIGLGVRWFARETNRAWLWMACTGGSLVALFHIVNWENLLRPFQVCLLLGYFLATLAITLAIRKAWPVSGSIAAGLLAPMCFLSALAIWPVMLAAAVAMGRRKKSILIMLTAGVVLFVAYFWGYHQAGRPIAITRLASQSHLAFFFGLIGKPFEPFAVFGPKGLGGPAGEIGLAVFVVAVALWAIGLVPALRNPMRIWTTANITFALGSLLMISAGRSDQGYAWRYMTPALLLWIFAAVGIGYELSRLRLEAVFTGFLLMFCVWTATRLVFQNRIRWEEAGVNAGRARIAGAAAVAGVEDPWVLVSIDSFGTLSRDVMNQLHEQRLMFWQFAPYNRIGSTLPRPSRVCEGSIEGVRPLFAPRPGFEIAGVSQRTSDGQTPAHQVYLLDDRNRVEGLSVKRDNGPQDKWIAFLPASAAGTTVTPVEVPADGRAPCLVTQPFKIEGDPARHPVFTDSDRARWIPIEASKTGELKLPDALSLSAPSDVSGGFNSVIIHVRLPKENFVYLTVPGKPPLLAYAPLANQWAYVVFHINRGEDGVPETPVFRSSSLLISYWPAQPGTGILDGAWITRDQPPASDQDALEYVDGSRLPH
jgi:hypothetical protein